MQSFAALRSLEFALLGSTLARLATNHFSTQPIHQSNIAGVLVITVCQSFKAHNSTETHHQAREVKPECKDLWLERHHIIAGAGRCR